MAEGQPHDRDAPKDYNPKPEAEWRHTHPFGIDYKEGYSKKQTHDMSARPGGMTSDMTVSQGAWNKDCAETDDGQEVVLSYSGGLVKDSGTIGSGAWHVKGTPVAWWKTPEPSGPAPGTLKDAHSHTPTGNTQGPMPYRAAERSYCTLSAALTPAGRTDGKGKYTTGWTMREW